MNSEFQNDLKQNIEIHSKLIQLIPQIEKTIKLFTNCIKKGGKILFCGNGGSAADAQHLAAEFLVRLRPKVNRRPLPALSLVQDISTITACGNDYSFNDIFVRPFNAIVKKNDLLIIISTSGNSKNIINVLKAAKEKNIKTIGFLNRSGGRSKKNCDVKLLVPSMITARVQECHIFLGHFILESVENNLIKLKK